MTQGIKIYGLKTNQIDRPLGNDFPYIKLSWKVKGAIGKNSLITQVQVSLDSEMKYTVFDSGKLVSYPLPNIYVDLSLSAYTRYYWRVYIKTDSEEVWSETTWFETGKIKDPWIAKWIGVVDDSNRMPILFKNFCIDDNVLNARLYIYGVGLYEAYLNNTKVGDEYLQPGYHSYDLINEYQTYDVTNQFIEGENLLSIILGEGWYKGEFGFDENRPNIYGDTKKCIAELRVTYHSGKEDVIITDKTWEAKESYVLSNGIYKGEHINTTLNCKTINVIEFDDSKELLIERSNPPVIKEKSIKPIKKTMHEDGYLILDFGEMITGWIELKGKLKHGQKVEVQYGELLQNNEFYNDNLRSAKAEFSYISNGNNEIVRPHFTYYGFRYAKVQSTDSIDNIDFTGFHIMSKIEQTGTIKTASFKVNQLIENTMRSQRCNFLDIPTDCPQRDERVGWTGDVTVFAKSACFHMNSQAFFRHYLRSLREEQKLLDGSIPFFSPLPKIPKHDGINPFYITNGACGWGDVATVLPWTLYEIYGDKKMLSENYSMMTGWVDYVTQRVNENSVSYLWQNDKHLGDWLALDNGNINNPIGKTDIQFLASSYYYLSVNLCWKAARELGDERENEFKELAANIKSAFIDFYFDTSGSLVIEPTQTAFATLIHTGLYPEKSEHKLKAGIVKEIEDNNGYINTGFLGTHLICPALTSVGRNDLAYKLLLNEGYPSWLYQVNLGATTIWERWNSLNSDGSISGTQMNSMNHYAYGSIAQWMYQQVCGFNPDMSEETFMTIRPNPHQSLQYIDSSFESEYGLYKSYWGYDNKLNLQFKITVPFNANAKLVLPNNEEHLLGPGEHEFYIRKS
ncbi:hypothetical protein AOC36_11080 [Erysipelothrix larvae]|uniref:alpha-L-rhamnosidase n=1 Tax=Erysipelothrix larvae TaxID=1514105 RepID=A0A0X8H1Q1_9FIRM|nr:alpha-L-rhamnosidase [Erysipelothrix larvae]AMC94494.1 hypothetical protein AOC36_11080 [Erysipelothrix larvae]